ncbi:competence protein ComFB, partial [Vibrio splendidus]
MQISVDVHNYMETLVGQVLATEEYVSSYNNEQLADLACLALGQLKPIYIRFDIDFLSALPEDKLVLYKRNSEIAVKNAESMI